MMKTVSVAVPVYNRFQMLKECLQEVLTDDRIDEIVVVDDCSQDIYWKQIQEWAEKHHKVKIFRNNVNLDCYRNKRQAVSHCTNDHVILFDSDNLLSKAYVDKIFEQAPWNEKTVYCPTFAMPHFDYTSLDGQIVSKATVKHFIHSDTFKTACNTANYLVPRQGYLDCFDPTVDPHTADSIFMAYRFLSRGYLLAFIKGLHYYHRVHDGSHYKNNVHKTGKFASKVEAFLKALK